MINKKWDIILKDELKKPYFKNLGIFVKDEYQKKIVYPEYKNIFNALKLTDYDEVKVVILGQDPYHGPKEAHGLSFSVQKGVKRPPSLDNIFKELKNDLGIERTNNDLTDWAKEGVFLLNSIMTVVKDSPLSHKDKGWETFTDDLIKLLNKREKPIVFILWGSYARSKKTLITNKNHYIIEAPHPSPLSAYRGFFGSKPFSKTNNFLVTNGIPPIKWGDEDE
ncbi:MAG: uracil-DNA glycosylase [Bacilli bacterium]|nr:uracil-DNA glycosylase [Bacilli bacterium]